MDQRTEQLEAMNAVIIHASGERTETAPANGEFFTLEEMQAAVGGYVEAHRLLDGRFMLVNEEGWDLPPNEVATVMAPHLNSGQRGITGDVLVCPASMLR